MLNKLSYIRENLYVLKIDYGQSVDLYKETSTVDFRTGKKIPVRNKLHIDNAIVLPTIDLLRGKNTYEAAFLRTQKNPVGSSIEIADRTIIIDATDIPDTYVIETNDYLIINNQSRYDIKDVTQYEFDAGYILNVKESKGAKLNQIWTLYLKDRLSINQEIA